MAPHSSIPTGKIPRMEEPGGLQSMGSQRLSRNAGLLWFYSWKLVPSSGEPQLGRCRSIIFFLSTQNVQSLCQLPIRIWVTRFNSKAFTNLHERLCLSLSLLHKSLQLRTFLQIKIILLNPFRMLSFPHHWQEKADDDFDDQADRNKSHI